MGKARPLASRLHTLAMHYLDESHILVFLVQLLLLLAVARTLGVACRAVRVPALAGEIFTGILLGPTLFGRISADQQARLFPPEVIQTTMLDTVAWLGVFFLLLSVGFEVDLPRVFRRGRAALSIGIIGVLVPIAIGFPVFWFLDPSYHGPSATRFGFALFLAVAGSITAISVVAGVLRDLDIVRTEAGNVILSSAAVNDVFGWTLFTVCITLATGGALDPTELLKVVGGVIGFGAICLLLGGVIVRHAARLVMRSQLPENAALLTLVTTVGLTCGVITHALGIHAILGFFLAGVVVGSVGDEITNEQKESLSDTVHAVFVPIFFATIGLKIDFFARLDLTITLAFTFVAIFGKLVGAWMGARAGRLTGSGSVLVGLAFTPGGAMEIVVGILALELGLISEVTFVGIVFAALLSSILVGPMMAAWMARSPDRDRLLSLRGAVVEGGARPG